jgi:regulatory protein
VKASPKKPLSAEALENRALYYLQRFSSTRANLRQVLLRKLRRHEPFDATAAALMVDALIAKLERSGYVNDERFAESRTASLARRGTSRRAIAAKLRGKGVKADLVQASLVDVDDAVAAIAFAKRKKLGVFRSGEAAVDRPRKDIAAMARAGFSYALSKRALEGGKA